MDAPIVVKSPTLTLSSITVYGPILTSLPIFDFFDIIAVGCIPEYFFWVLSNNSKI